MMDTRFRIPLVVAAAMALAVAGFWWWHGRDERAIRRSISTLAGLLSKTSEESDIAAMVRTKKIIGFFATPLDLRLGAPFHEITERDEGILAIHQVRASVKSLRVIVRDAALSVADNRTSASASVAVEGVVVVQNEPTHEIREFELDWVKRDGDWLIAKVNVTETIRPPPASADSP